MKTLVLLLVFLTSLAQSSLAQEPQEAQEYVIGTEDVLDIAVWDNAAISRTVPVRPDGRISLPLLNDVMAVGLTPSQLRQVLMKALVSYMPTPSVSVIVREVHSYKVAVIGEVKLPGRFELKSQATILEVLAMAGGLSEYAARGRIVVFRLNGGSTKRIPFDYDKLLAKSASAKSGDENFCVLPGDVIVVP